MESHYWERARSFIRSDLADYDLHVFIYKIAHSLVSIFVPVILLMSGYSLFLIVFYLIANHLIKPIFIYASGILAGEIGIRNTMFIGLLGAIAHYGLLYFLTTPTTEMLLFLTLTAGVFNGFYWGPQRAIIMPALPKKRIAFNLAGISFFRMLSSIASPLVGAAIIIFFGKDAIVAVAGTLMLVSLVPLYKMRNNDFKRKIGLLDLLSQKKHFHNLSGLFFMGAMENAHNTLWPFFVFIALRDVAMVGYVGAILPAVTVAIAFFVGKMSDANRGRNLFLLSSVVIAATFFARTLWTTQLAVLAFTVVYAFFHEPFSLPTYAATYAEGKKKYSAEYSLLMELMKHASKLLMLLPFIFFLTFDVPFAVAGVLCLAWGVMHTLEWNKPSRASTA